MTKEEKQLLLKDLCARLSYGVVCHTEKGDGHLCSINQTIFGTEYGLNINPLKRDYFNDSETEWQVIKPYLRPMSSMTGEEIEEYTLLSNHCISTSTGFAYIEAQKLIEWLIKNMFDYCGLIPMGLALEAKEGMYKTE